MRMNYETPAQEPSRQAEKACRSRSFFTSQGVLSRLLAAAGAIGTVEPGSSSHVGQLIAGQAD